MTGKWVIRVHVQRFVQRGIFFTLRRLGLHDLAQVACVMSIRGTLLGQSIAIDERFCVVID